MLQPRVDSTQRALQDFALAADAQLVQDEQPDVEHSCHHSNADCKHRVLGVHSHAAAAAAAAAAANAMLSASSTSTCKGPKEGVLLVGEPGGQELKAADGGLSSMLCSAVALWHSVASFAPAARLSAGARGGDSISISSTLGLSAIW